jgi:hypothetical protein
MDEPKPKGYLAKYGAKVIDRGYAVVPIRRGTKRPPFDAWTEIRATKKLLQSWLDGTAVSTIDKRPVQYNASRDGLGIITTNTPLVDLDIRDEAMADAMQAFVFERFGVAPIRVGQAPKRGLLYRTDAPFTKVQSDFWINPWADDNDDDGKPIKHKVEILGAGQQFVAYARHPDTGEPYRWLSAAQPAVTPVADLPVLHEADAEIIVAEFERLAADAGWELKPSASKALTLRRTSAGRQFDLNDPFAEDAQIVDIDEDELERKLMLVPGADEYDVWFQIGMSLYHQYSGDQRGLDLWHQWSALAHNYDSAACDEKWPTFDIESKGRAPLTARIILKLAKEVEQEEAKETLAEIKADLALATDLSNLRAVAARIKLVEFDPMVRVQLVAIVQDKFKAITGSALPIGVARDMTRYESPEKKVAPKWLEGWVYCEFDEIFYSMTDRKSLTTTAFNQAYGRKLLTAQEKLEGKSAPEQAPSQVALNLYEIPVVYMRQYMPGEDDIFWMNGVRYVNTYDGRNVPEIPERVSREERLNVERVIYHFEHMFAEVADRQILIDAIAYVVQNPGKRLNWGILIQGTEMDGKTFFYRLLVQMLGLENTKTIGAQAVEEKYTAWAEGHQIVFIEEIKLHGHNRFDVLNRLKPLITNDMIPIRRMQTDTYMVPNTATYFLATNFKDAMPLNDNDTRYFVMFSRFQTKAQIKEFKRANPDYYRLLHEALLASPGPLRKWFMERVISENFDPNDRAPESVAKAEMISLSKSDEQEGLELVLRESVRMDLTRVLLNATALADAMEERGVDAPYGRSMQKLLLDNGFSKLGPVYVDDRKCLFWSMEPRRFMKADGEVDGNAVRTYAKDTL